MSARETIACDVLVVGAGIAGLRAAIAAQGEGARVAVACKSLLGKAASVLDGSAIPAGFDALVRELESWGGVFGHRTGLEILRTLQHRAVSLGIPVCMEHQVVRLLVPRGRIAGALALRKADGAVIRFHCAAVVLATGNGERAFDPLAAADETGDGYLLAQEAGAKLADMPLRETGGVATNDAGATAVPGLFAAGNLISGRNARERHGLAGALLSGQRAGLGAAAHAQSTARLDSDAPLDLPMGEGGEDPHVLLRELQAETAKPRPSLAVIRELGSRAAKVTVRGPRAWNASLHLAFELRGMLFVAEEALRRPDERAWRAAGERRG